MEPRNAIELFGGLIGVLESLIGCRTGTISLRIYDISEIKSIRTKIFKCNPDEALDRIELALERLEEIKKLGMATSFLIFVNCVSLYLYCC